MATRAPRSTQTADRSKGGRSRNEPAPRGRPSGKSSPSSRSSSAKGKNSASKGKGSGTKSSAK
ncbi:MAG: hypothetical protein ACRDNF_15275, partial [Streptosporangiaceae bacterium]